MMFLTIATMVSAQEENIMLADMLHVSIGTIKQEYVNGSFKNKFEWAEKITINQLMAIDLNKNIIKIGNEANSTYYLKARTSIKDVNDDDGDMTTFYTFPATDEENLKCTIRIRLWDEYTIIQVYADYNEITYLWDGKVRMDDGTFKKTNTSGTSDLKI